MNRQIYEEASHWLVELRVGDIDAAARERLDTWFRASPQNIRAFLEVSNIWEEAGDQDLDRRHSTEELIARARAATNIVLIEVAARGHTTPQSLSENLHPQLSESVEPTSLSPAPRSAAEFAIAAQGFKTISATSRPAPSAARGVRYRVAASLAFLSLTIGAVGLYRYWTPTYSTGTGEQRALDLSDGSVIALNARSRVRVKFSKAERDVELLAGQAMFMVAKDASRPFVVKSDGTRVRAVGTQFDIYRKVTGTTVTVVEGRVAVLPEGLRVVSPHDSGTDPATGSPIPESSPPPASSALFLSAGEQVTVSPSQVTKPAHPDLVAAIAWTKRELVFDGTPLTEVASEFNRYNEKPLIVSDAALKDFHVTGVFSSTNPASLIKFLRAQKGIQVRESADGILIDRG